jgi:lipopolysaccharide export system permease protein
MRRLECYIARQLLVATGAAVLVLTLIVMLAQSLRLIDLVVNRGAPFSLFLALAGLMLPNFLLLVLPLAFVAAAVWLVYRLQQDHEWVIFAASGLSPWQLARPFLLLSLGISLLCYSISAYFLPVSYRAFKDMEFAVRGDTSAAFVEEGVFSSLGDAMTVFAAKRLPDGQLQGLMLHDGRNPERSVTILAESAHVIKDNNETLLVIKNGSRQEYDLTTNRVQFLYFSQYAVDMATLLDAPGIRRRSAQEEMTIPALLMADAAEYTSPQRAKLFASGNARLTNPLLALSYTAAALALLVFTPFQRRGTGRTLLFVALTVFGLQGFMLFFENAAAKIPFLVIGLYVSACAPLALGLFRLRYERWPWRGRA